GPGPHEDVEEGLSGQGRQGRRGEERREGQEVTSMTLGLPYLGHGVGLRREHYAEVVRDQPPIDWLEVISEHFMVPRGNARRVLAKIRERTPVVLHGVSLSIGSTDPLDHQYLDSLAELARDVEPAWMSDHLCWGAVGGRNSHDLLPLPYTEEALAHVVA